MEKMRKCDGCSEDLPEAGFYVKARYEDGSIRYDGICKSCRKEKNNSYRAKNREKYKEKKREWDRRNADKLAESRRKRIEGFSEEELKEFRRRQNVHKENMRQRRIDEYLERYGSYPVCVCGCGEHASFDDKGKPNDYKNGHQNRGRQVVINYEFSTEDIVDSDIFKDFVDRAREHFGVTVRKLAEMGGISYGHLTAILYNPHKYNHGLNREWVERFVLRVNGRPAPPTPHMLRVLQKKQEAYNSTEPSWKSD
jgi:hypothetical protein